MNRLDRLRGRYRVQAEPLKTERRIELLLLCLAVLVAVQLVWMGLRIVMPTFMSMVPPSTDSLMVQAGGHTGSVTTQDSLLLQSRPLFWGSRRPTEAPPVQQTDDLASAQSGQVVSGLKNLQVSGVYGGGDTGGAIVKYKGDQRRIVVGQELDGWTLERVGHGEAVWSSGGREDVRRLLPLTVEPSVNEASQPPDNNKQQGSSAERSLTTGGLPPAPAAPRPKRDN